MLSAIRAIIKKGAWILENKLKEKREQLGYTQEQMAEKLGYSSKSGYNMLENGNVKLSLEKAKILSNLLNIPLNEIQ